MFNKTRRFTALFVALSACALMGCGEPDAPEAAASPEAPPAEPEATTEVAFELGDLGEGYGPYAGAFHHAYVRVAAFGDATLFFTESEAEDACEFDPADGDAIAAQVWIDSTSPGAHASPEEEPFEVSGSAANTERNHRVSFSDDLTGSVQLDSVNDTEIRGRLEVSVPAGDDHVAGSFRGAFVAHRLECT